MHSGVTIVQKSNTLRGEMNGKTYFHPVDIALIGVFCALWAILSLTLGRLSFALLRLPVLHDFAAFFTLILVAWATRKFGTAALVGIIGSIMVLLVGGPFVNMGFAASAIVFDTLLLANRHRLNSSVYSIVISVLATLVSAYLAGVLIGVFLMNSPLEWATVNWALIYWGPWHLVGGIISIAIGFPIIGILEAANVRKIISEG